MPCVQGQNQDKGKPGHDIDKLPAVLSKMQARDLGKCATAKNIHYQSASRLDAEPITYENIVVIGSFYETKLKPK